MHSVWPKFQKKELEGLISREICGKWSSPIRVSFCIPACRRCFLWSFMFGKSSRNLAYCDPNVDPTPVGLGILLHVDILLKELHL